RAGAAALRAFDNLEVLQRGRIDQQPVAALAVPNGAHVGEVEFLCAPQVVYERACGGDRGAVSLQAEAFETARPKLIEERAARGRPGNSRRAACRAIRRGRLRA